MRRLPKKPRASATHAGPNWHLQARRARRGMAAPVRTENRVTSSLVPQPLDTAAPRAWNCPYALLCRVAGRANSLRRVVRPRGLAPRQAGAAGAPCGCSCRDRATGGARTRVTSCGSMVQIAISAEAYAAIAAILPPGAHVGPLAIAPNGQYRVWLPRAVVDRLARKRGPRESYSDVVLRLAARGEPV